MQKVNQFERKNYILPIVFCQCSAMNVLLKLPVDCITSHLSVNKHCVVQIASSYKKIILHQCEKWDKKAFTKPVPIQLRISQIRTLNYHKRDRQRE